ncbi:hypothetical protein PHYBLDRAFT_109665 [Phycomyces blakesleeanus NRRL 1555(-)]|uniref:DUF7082 domain-containing protein n=2 Tax=Phycomyces blakesleeanus TaxID=4837 RepID=A0A167NUL7_PHYB8|nr:hypothetical protein PHYBLDRAFT_109665 [Phycomyces blakesleeanus NRRL 1555(-)]OAD76648.1 hypothetical protein PHYBLDRAFT_109665 [Phycomyces blakesleeanus NRRL 1555(-)]|eukprot:XP_018294688.1 hypothetical protein PHYBLDRAFT_109665 [Phycomyces blakesleeanus NRRL 1555(-)]
MVNGWSPDEVASGRRLVQFHSVWTNSTVRCVVERYHSGSSTIHPNDVTRSIASCIRWPGTNKYYITSVDCINIIQSIMNIRLQVEEKNRVRRNLEGYKPITVSKCHPETADFFKLIMGFQNPKPRNIEKDIKVFPWETLEDALQKVVIKYTAARFVNRNAPQ